MWTDEYREIVEFYYWEPQHIGRAGGVKRFANADEMYRHVHRLEVSLNHILNIFFSLFPLNKLPTMFSSDQSYVMLSAAQLEAFQREQRNTTQPDMFFVGECNNIAIELKTKSKCSVTQVQKYIQFHKAISEAKKPLEIIILAPIADIAKVFTGCRSTDEVLDQVTTDTGVTLHTMSYADFYNELNSLQPTNLTEQKLLSGLLAYLESRDDLNI